MLVVPCTTPRIRRSGMFRTKQAANDQDWKGYSSSHKCLSRMTIQTERTNPW